MSYEYEFGYQSKTQKAVLIVLKVILLLLLADSFYSLGWIDQSFQEKLRSIGGVFIGFWIYSNLLRVKTEIKELFIPPFKIFFALEFMLIGFLISVYSTFDHILQIVLLHLN